MNIQIVKSIKKNLLILTILAIENNFEVKAQLIIPAANPDNAVLTSSATVVHTNNDSRTLVFGNNMNVIVYDGSQPELHWDDGTFSGNVVLGAGVSGAVPDNPDVCLLDDGKWAVVVYRDAGNGNQIVAESYQWSGTAFGLYSTKIFYQTGFDPKIDSHNNNEFAIVWTKQNSTYGTLCTSAGDMTGNVPTFYNVVTLEDATTINLWNTTDVFTTPDISILEDNGYYPTTVFYSYIMDDGTDTYWIVEHQKYADLQANTLNYTTNVDIRYMSSGVTFALPRISTNPFSYQGNMDYATIVEATTSTNWYIYGL